MIHAPPANRQEERFLFFNPSGSLFSLHNVSNKKGHNTSHKYFRSIGLSFFLLGMVLVGTEIMKKKAPINGNMF